MISIIIGVRERIENIKLLCKDLSVNDSNVFYDDNSEGPLMSVIRGLKEFKNKDSHILILQDDACLCNNFLQKCDIIINTHPTKVIGLFPYDFLDKKINPIQSDSPYYGLKILSGVGIIFPTIYADKFIEYCSVYGDCWMDDLTLRNFCLCNQIKMIQTIPALVQHIGDKSILNERERIRRTEYFYNGETINWSSEKINELKYYSSLDIEIAKHKEWQEKFLKNLAKRGS